jgi:hypothetical protein
MLKTFSKFLNKNRWDERFEMEWDIFLDQVADANLRIFMGESAPNSLAA